MSFYINNQNFILGPQSFAPYTFMALILPDMPSLHYAFHYINEDGEASMVLSFSPLPEMFEKIEFSQDSKWYTDMVLLSVAVGYA
jgi:hypothetical protein